MLLLRPLGQGARLTRGAALVTYGYPHQVVFVVQLADDPLTGGVHDRVGDQLGDDEGRRVAGVLAHRPAGQPGVGQTSGPGHGARVRGQLEAEPALGGQAGAGPGGGTETGSVLDGGTGTKLVLGGGAGTAAVLGGVCS